MKYIAFFWPFIIFLQKLDCSSFTKYVLVLSHELKRYEKKKIISLRIKCKTCLDKIISEKLLKTIELQCYLHQVSLGSCKCKQKQACRVKLNTLRLRSIHPLVSVQDLNFRLGTQTKALSF